MEARSELLKTLGPRKICVYPIRIVQITCPSLASWEVWERTAPAPSLERFATEEYHSGCHMSPPQWELEQNQIPPAHYERVQTVRVANRKRHPLAPWREW